MLSRDAVRNFYDTFGARQDAQAFYEDRATNLLIEHARFESAGSVFELGVGTGRFAEKLLSTRLPADCAYRGVDISSTMIGLAGRRLQRFGERVSLRLASGPPPLEEGGGAFDRFVSNYVFDLFSEDEGRAFVREAHRMLRPDGLLCVVSLSEGRALHARLVCAAWKAVYRIGPGSVGGCRPIRFPDYLAGGAWEVLFRGTVTSFGVSSEAVVARKAP